MTYITKVASRGVAIDELEVTIEAQVDLQGTFEIDSVRAGLSDVTVTVGFDPMWTTTSSTNSRPRVARRQYLTRWLVPCPCNYSYWGSHPRSEREERACRQ